MIEFPHRVCPVTGMKICPQAEALLRWNAVTAIVFFLVGVVCALLLALTRWQAVHLLPVTWYYRILTAHGLNMLIFFIIFFEMAVLYFAGPILLGCRQPAPKVGWAGYILMLVGALVVNGFVFAGKADVLFTSYVPLKAHPGYYLGIILFAVGALAATSLFFAALVRARKHETYQGSIPLVTFGALTAAIIAVITLLHGAAIYIPTFLWSLDLMKMDAQVYRMVWWALGHSSQQINMAAQVSCWYLLAALTVGGVVLNEKISRISFALYILFISMASAHHLLVDPGLSPAWKVWNTSYAMYLAVLASMVHGFTVPGGIEMGQRLRGFTQGKFQWLTRAPWGDPGFSALFLSLVIFGFGGGITGVVIGTEQINIIAHNTLRIPGHFHMTVVGGTALCFMGVTYYLLPLIFRRRIALYPLARIQPYLFGGGITLMGISMTYAGTFGVPRRHWDISFTGAPFGIQFPPVVDLFMAATAIGGILAFLGGMIYVAVAVISVFFTPRLSDSELTTTQKGLPSGVIALPRQVHTKEQAELAHRQGTPGTIILVVIFFVCFVLYYFANWKVLAMLWKVG